MSRYRKHISAFIVITMLLSLFLPSVCIFASEDYSDYMPGDRPDNIILNGTDINAIVVHNSGAGGEYNYKYPDGSLSYKTGDFFSWREKPLAPDSNYNAGPGYFHIREGDLSEEFVKDKNYVISVRLKNESTDIRPVLTFGFDLGTRTSAGGSLVKFDVDSAEYKTYSAVFTADTDAKYAPYGLEASIDRRSLTEFGVLTMDFSKDGSLYVAEETAYEIKNVVTGSTAVHAGSSTTVKTEILNQIGLKGNIKQSVEYLVLNADRTSLAEGITVVPNADGSAQVQVSENAKDGQYVILARSTEYPGFQKGAEVLVLSPDSFKDYVPGDKPENMVKNPHSETTFTTTNSLNASFSYVSGISFSWTEMAEKADENWYAIPTYLNTTSYQNLKTNLTQGTPYVVSARLKNDSPSGKDMEFAVGYNHKLLGSAMVNNTVYEEKTIYFTPDIELKGLALGLPGKVDRSAYTDLGTITMDISNGGSLYVAPEIIYDITVDSKDAPDIFEGGISFSLDAAIVNQLGQKGTITQPDFEWYALNADKTDIAEGINLTYGANSASVQVSLSEDISAGTYCIVAKSRTQSDMVRTYCISIGVMEEHIPGEKPDDTDEEIAYDIVASSDKEGLLSGEALTASASLINQFGTTGTLSQNFTWQVLDKNCAPYDGDYFLNVSPDTTSATLTVGERMPLGTYFLAACSLENNMNKFIKFRVVEDGISYYVSPDGDDTGDGSIESPFATIERARQEVAEIKNKDTYEFIEVVLRGGEYRIYNTVSFGSSDSGTENTPIVYRAYEGEEPVIKGSVVLDGAKFRKALSSDIVPRLNAKAQGRVYVTNLSEHGLKNNDIFDMSQSIATLYSLAGSYEMNGLFADGIQQTVSQWPNGREYAVRGDAIIDEIYVDEETGKNVNVSTSFYYTDEEPDRWSQAENWYIGAFIPYDYSYARLSVESVDNQNKILKVHAPSNRKSFNFTNNFSKRWKAFNLLEEIDVPGEYYIDSENKLLYYYPKESPNNAKLEFAVMFDELISVNDASNIVLSGITFSQTNGMAVKMSQVNNVDIRNCTFDSIGGRAVYITGDSKANTGKDHWQRQIVDASYNTDIIGCRFFNLANSAIYMTGGNVDTLTPSNNIIENNIISGFSLNTLSSSDGAIAIGGCGVTVRGNNISNSPGKAIQIMGNDHIIEYNEIYDVMREVQDAGAIYQGQNTLARGTVIRYNYLHDMRPVAAISDDSAQVGIYLDDCQHDLTVVNNIIKNVKIDFNSNGAGAFTFSGNTSVDVDKSWNLLNHPLTSGYTVTEGYEGELAYIKTQLYDSELYYERYPELKEFLDSGKNPKRYTVVEDNITVNTGKTNIELQDSFYATKSNNQKVTDAAYSIFVDPENQDYRIKSGSEYATDSRVTQNFNINKIGVDTDVVLNEKTAPFGKIYPKEASTVPYSDNGITFMWDNAFGANEYILIIATDSALSQKVHEQTVRTPYCTVNTLDTDKTYYWTVIAANTSREFTAKWGASDGTNSFALSEYSEDVSLVSTTMDVSEGFIDISTTVVNNRVTGTDDFTVYFVAYDGSTLVSVQGYDKIVPVTNSADVSHRFELEDGEEISSIKILVWIDGSLIPVREAEILR